jgi:prepilin signal peptidase PulO-like enzyme (type II secretory pathway)
MTGIFLGWFQVLASLFLGSFLGVLVLTPFLLGKKIDRKTPVPFGPFLVIATLAVIYGWQFMRGFLPGG